MKESNLWAHGRCLVVGIARRFHAGELGRRSIFVISLCAALLLVAACASPESPSSEEPLQPVLTSTPRPFLPRAEIRTATPEIVATSPEPAAVDSSTAVPSSLPPADLEREDAVSSSPATYTVQPGDTLIGLAMKFGVPMAAIQLSNNMGDETTVRIDQVLKVPQEAMWAKASTFWVVHQVAAGETLTALAAYYGLDLGALLDANGLTDADMIAIGQLLVLPLVGPAELVAEASVPTAVPEPEIAPTSTPEMAAVAEAPAAALAGAAAEPVTVSPTATPVLPTVTPVPPSSPPVEVSALAGEIFRLINEQRAVVGLAPLAWNDTLAYAAQLHADDCYARGWCGHTGSDGSTYKTRIIRAGYDPVRWSECWAWYGTPEMAVAMWMDEVPPNDPHRRTILSDFLVEVGVGVVPGNGHGYYFIADFGTPR